ncbi:unnamed protein product [Urochloa humidicola]
MALRALVGKLRNSPAAETASRTFSKTCENCGKTSSRIALSVGQKDGAIKESEGLKRLRRKHYMIRTLAIAASLTTVGLTLSGAIAFLEDEENFRAFLEDKENSRRRK